MITTEQTRQTVNRFGADVECVRLETVKRLSYSLELAVTGAGELSELVAENRRRLSRGEIDAMEFGKNEEVEISFLSNWVESSLSVLELVSVFSEIADSDQANLVRTLVKSAQEELQTREDSRQRIDEFLATHPIPASWNAELAQRNMEADVCGEGIDLRDYLASLPR